MTTKTEQAQAADRLREMFPKHSTVYTILRHVSRSGMQRTIGVLAIRTEKPGEMQVLSPNWLVGQVLGLRDDRDRDGVIVYGGGMDMGFDLVYGLGQALYGDGFGLKHRWL